MECAWAWRALDARLDVFVEDEEGHVGRCLVPCARRRAANPSDADAVDAVVVTLSRADTACLPPPPPVM